MPVQDKAIKSLRRNLALVLILKHALAYTTAWAFLWGTAVLILRASSGTPRLPLLWGLAGLPVALIPAMVVGLRRVPSPTAVRALLDRHSGCGGLLMAEEEVPLGGWQRKISAIARPRVRWQAGRSWTLFAAAATFVLLGFLVPQRFATLGAETPFEIDREVNRLAQQIEVLKEEAILEPERAEALQQKLNQLRDEASGKDPVKTLEALDHLQDVATRTAEAAAEESLRKTEKLSQAESLAEALQRSGSSLDAKVLTRAMAELSAMAEKAAADSEKLQKQLDAETLKGGKEGGLSEEDLKKLTEALRGSKKDLAEQLEKLYKAGLIDLDKLKECEKCGKCAGDELAAFLKENGDKLSEAELLALCKCCKPGRGDVTRGRGDAPLTWGKGTEEDGAKFKEVILPPANLEALKESKLTGVSRDRPKTEPEGGPSTSGALQGATAGGGSAHTQVILPRHRGTVERFFERPAKAGK